MEKQPLSRLLQGPVAGEINLQELDVLLLLRTVLEYFFDILPLHPYG